MLGTETRALHLLGKGCTTKLYPCPWVGFFIRRLKGFKWREGRLRHGSAKIRACQEEGPVWLEHTVDVGEGIDKIGTG